MSVSNTTNSQVTTSTSTASTESETPMTTECIGECHDHCQTNGVIKTPHGIRKIPIEQVKQEPLIDDQTSKTSPDSKDESSSSRAAGKPKYACKFLGCKQTFTKYFNMRRHVLLCHTKIQPFKCPFCPKGFALLQYYKDHLLQHVPLHAADYYLAKNNSANQQCYPLFFVEPADENDLLDDYMKSKIMPEFLQGGPLPLPSNF